MYRLIEWTMLFFSIAHLANTRKWKNTMIHSNTLCMLVKQTVSTFYNIAYQKEYTIQLLK